MKMLKCSAVLAAASVVLLGACSTTKAPVQGSAEWLYAAARDSYNAGDLEKAKEHLAKIEQKGANPFVQRARVWRMVLGMGLGNAHLELAQAYGEGSNHAGAGKTAFVRQKSEHLRDAKRHAIHLVEAYDAFVKEPPGQTVLLDFGFPKGSGAPVPDLDRIYKGMTLPEEQRNAAEAKVIERGAVRAVSAVLATADDSAGAQDAMKAGKADVPPVRFLAATGMALQNLGTVFDRKGLDEGDKLKLFRERTLDACKRALELKPDAKMETALKKLQADVEKALKTPPGRIQSTSR